MIQLMFDFIGFLDFNFFLEYKILPWIEPRLELVLSHLP
jgi:hypothetical protein